MELHRLRSTRHSDITLLRNCHDNLRVRTPVRSRTLGATEFMHLELMRRIDTQWFCDTWIGGPELGNAVMKSSAFVTGSMKQL